MPFGEVRDRFNLYAVAPQNSNSYLACRLVVVDEQNLLALKNRVAATKWWWAIHMTPSVMRADSAPMIRAESRGERSLFCRRNSVHLNRIARLVPHLRRSLIFWVRMAARYRM